MINHIDRLEKAITDLSTCATPWQIPSREKAVLLYGGRVTVWVRDIQETLTKQLHWLDEHPDNDQRHDEWVALLRQYERAVDLLVEAERVMGKVAA
jgi:hypothetical protein